MGLLFASCSKDVNLSSPTPANNGNQQHAEDALGITIAFNQTWVMSKNYTMNIAQWPSDIEVQQIAVMDANPLTTRDAATLAISDKASSIRFEAANGIKQLYAVCIAADGGEVTVTPTGQTSRMRVLTSISTTRQRIWKSICHQPKD